MKNHADFAGLMEGFFTERLMSQRRVSPQTVSSYRDAFRLIFSFAQTRLKKSPSNLQLQDLDAPFISRFLEHLETERRNTARSRNARLAAIHSFFRYAALQCPEHSALIQRVLAMPSKRYAQPDIAFLIPAEVSALLAAPDKMTWTGRRDYALLLVAIQTGLRVSELIGLRCQDVRLGTTAYVQCRGKGRKDRCTPLRKEAAVVISRWLRERNGKPDDALFPNARGDSLSRDGVEYLLARYVALAAKRCPSLNTKRVSPHVLRHTAAMDLLQAGVDRAVIALWLGHETLNTVHVYLHANLKLKEQALAKTASVGAKAGRYHPDDRLLAFLKSL
jgi:site-specific recombinase XerD